jgi:aspartate aminotransferase
MNLTNMPKKGLFKLSAISGKLKGSPMLRLFAMASEMERAGKKLYHFELGEPDFDTPKEVKDAAVAALRAGQTGYENSLGLLELREALRQHTKRVSGFLPDVEQVAVAPAKALIYFFIRLLCDPGDEVLLPDPGYPVYYSIFSLVGCRGVAVPLRGKNGYRMAPADVAERITPKTKLIILNSPNNPTGAVMDRASLKEIYELARRRGIYVLSDEPYAELVYSAKHYSPGRFDRCKKNVIVLGSFSKAYAMTGWRLGWAVAPEKLIAKIDLLVQTVFTSLPAFVQAGGLAALALSPKYLNSARKKYGERRKLMRQLLNRLPGVVCADTRGAMYLFPDISRTKMSDEEFARFALEKAGVVVVPGREFGRFGKNHVRLTFAASPAQIRAGLTRLAAALRSARRAK